MEEGDYILGAVISYKEKAFISSGQTVSEKTEKAFHKFLITRMWNLGERVIYHKKELSIVIVRRCRAIHCWCSIRWRILRRGPGSSVRSCRPTNSSVSAYKYPHCLIPAQKPLLTSPKIILDDRVPPLPKRPKHNLPNLQTGHLPSPMVTLGQNLTPLIDHLQIDPTTAGHNHHQSHRQEGHPPRQDPVREEAGLRLWGGRCECAGERDDQNQNH